MFNAKRVTASVWARSGVSFKSISIFFGSSLDLYAKPIVPFVLNIVCTPKILNSETHAESP